MVLSAFLVTPLPMATTAMPLVDSQANGTGLMISVNSTGDGNLIKPTSLLTEIFERKKFKCVKSSVTLNGWCAGNTQIQKYSLQNKQLEEFWMYMKSFACYIDYFASRFLEVLSFQ